MTTRRRGNDMTAREAALQMIYALDLGGQSPSQIAHWYMEAHPLPPESAERARALLAAVVEHQVEIDALITRYAIGWQLPRMNVVDRSLLRLAVAEMLPEAPVPAREIIPATLKLAHKFSHPEAIGFVQGLLEAIARALAAVPEVAPHVG